MSDETGLQVGIRSLIDGIAVVFDDEARTAGTIAYELVATLRRVKFPVVDYIDPPHPDDGLVKNLHGASFVIFDWKFTGQDSSTSATDENGEPVPGQGRSELEAETDADRVAALKALLDNTYCPIFLVTQEDISVISSKLDTARLTQGGKHPRILFCSKSDLQTDKKQFWRRIKEWIDANRPIYVLKKWELAERQARQNLFSSLEWNCDWPAVLWKAYRDDGEDSSIALAEFICKSVAQRTVYNCSFARAQMKGSGEESISEIGSVISADRYMSIPADSDEPYVAGDVFEIEGRWFVNVRATCDTIHCDPVELYLLPCYNISLLPDDYDVKAHEVRDQGGQLVRWDKSFIIPYSIDGETVEVDFTRLCVRKIKKSEKDTRIGRILPPFLTRLQQLYSTYIVREGLPVTPKQLRDHVLSTPQSAT